MKHDLNTNAMKTKRVKWPALYRKKDGSGWIVAWKHAGRKQNRTFSTKKCGDKAYEMAKALRKTIIEQVASGAYVTPPYAPKIGKGDQRHTQRAVSGYKNVAVCYVEGVMVGWIAIKRKKGERRRKKFTIEAYGDEAFTMACEFAKREMK